MHHHIAFWVLRQVVWRLAVVVQQGVAQRLHWNVRVLPQQPAYRLYLVEVLLVLFFDECGIHRVEDWTGICLRNGSEMFANDISNRVYLVEGLAFHKRPS